MADFHFKSHACKVHSFFVNLTSEMCQEIPNYPARGGVHMCEGYYFKCHILHDQFLNLKTFKTLVHLYVRTVNCIANIFYTTTYF